MRFMQQSDEGDTEPTATVNKQFGDRMREIRESRRWSQRRLAELLQAVGLHLDPSAITRIERGTRDVKLTEAIAIADVLEFELDSISFSPEERFRMGEWSLVAAAQQARKSLLDAIRQVDRFVNQIAPDTEKRLIEKRGLSGIVDLYTKLLRENPAFQRGNRLEHVEGDNFAVYYTDDDRAVKQAIVEAVTNHILISEDDFEKALGHGLARLIPTESDPRKGQTDDVSEA